MNIPSSSGTGWVASPFPGVAYNYLKLNGTAPAVVALRRIDAGASMPAHRHPTVERNYLISGRAQLLDGSIIEAGTYLEIEAGVRHGATALEECVFHDSYDGSLVWIEDNGTITSVNSTGGFDNLGTIAPPNANNIDL